MEFKKIILNAEGGSFGRICSYAVKQALEGNEIVIVNSEKAIISGNKKDTILKYRESKQKGGSSLKGPKYINVAYRILKRGIRGMLPDHRGGQGKLAFSRIKCHNGVPAEFKEMEMEKMKGIRSNKYITLHELIKKI